MTYIKFILVAAISCLSIVSEAQNLLDLLGLPYNSPALTSVRKSYKTENPSELLIPALQTVEMSYPQDGIKMEFTSDLSLYKIGLYDSGYTYNAYTGDLPFGLSWGMSYLELEDKIGMQDFVKGNPFIRRMEDSLYTIDFYFNDYKLDHLRITATAQTIINHTEDILVGTGLRLIPNGTAVEGNVTDGMGTMQWGNNAAVYKGDWLYGLPHGRGQFKDSAGNKYEGEFKLGFSWGQGNFYSEQDKYSYSGEYVMSKKHGEGRIGYSNEIAYQGEWVQDIMHGTGTYAMGKEYLYEGQFQNGQFNGPGKLTTQQGYIEGSFRNGKPHGICTQATNDGSYVIKGKFVNGVKEGPFTITYNGETRTAIYEHDIEVKAGTIDPTLLPKQ